MSREQAAAQDAEPDHEDLYGAGWGGVEHCFEFGVADGFDYEGGEL